MYAVGSALARQDRLASPRVAVGVLLAMALWTALMVARPVPSTPRLVADLLVALACQQATVLVLSEAQIQAGEATLTVAWAAVPVAAWAVRGGWRYGGLAGVLISVGAVVERQGASQATVNSCVLLVLLGTVVGYLVQVARGAEAAYAEAVRREAETRERERLAREVHDGVLQALALVARRSTDPELARLATGQEQALRRLVAGPAATPTGESDLRALLPALPGVEVAAPAGGVPLPGAVAAELAAAVAAAVDNALVHGGGRAWVLVEDLGNEVVVSVRDDGPGMAPGRLEEAGAQGRMGHARSVVGRLADLGGSVSVVSAPGQGTEVELRVPR